MTYFVISPTLLVFQGTQIEIKVSSIFAAYYGAELTREGRWGTNSVQNPNPSDNLIKFLIGSHWDAHFQIFYILGYQPKNSHFLQF